MIEKPSNGEKTKMPTPPETDYIVPEQARLAEAYDRIDMLRKRLDDLKKANLPLWQTIFKKQKVSWTTESNAIEGSSLSFGDTLFFLEEGLTVEGKPFKDFLDARNHAEAIDLLYETITDERPITPSFLKEINALLLSGVTHTPAIDAKGRPVEKPAQPGAYKKLPNNVLLPNGTLKAYIDPIHVPAEIEQLCKWANENDVHPITKAALAHYNFVTIHPFDDGNGRGARILMNLILIKAGYPSAILLNSERATYLEALRAGQDGDGTLAFVTYITDTLEATLQSLIQDFETNS